MNRSENWAEVSVEELYQLVWEKPMQALAQEFGISDVGLAKVCKRHSIPRPERGYWAKLYSGRKMKKPSLPKSAKRNEIIRIVKTEKIELPIDPKQPVSKIIVHDTLRNPHPLIEMAQKNMTFNQHDDGRSCSPKNMHCLSIRATKQTFPRALRIMDAVIKTLEEAGLIVKLNSQGATRIVAEDMEIGLLIREPLKMIKTPLDPDKDRFEIGFGHQYRAVNQLSGKLYLELEDGARGGVRSCWRDTDKRRLEDSIVGFIESVQKHAVAKRQWLLELEAWRRECRERERLHFEESQRESELKEQLAAFTYCETLRNYANRLRKGIAEASGKDPEGKAAEWIAWIERRADRHDAVAAFVSKHTVSEQTDDGEE